MDWMHAHAAEVGWILIGGTLLLFVLVWSLGRRSPDDAQNLGADLFHAAATPFLFALWYYATFYAAPYVLRLLHTGWDDDFDAYRGRFWHFGLVLGTTWLLYRLVRVAHIFLSRRAARTPGSLDDYLFRAAAVALRTTIPLCGLTALLRLLLPKDAWNVAEPFLAGAFIVAAARVLLFAVGDAERTIVGRLDLTGPDAYAARGIQTRVRILRKFAAIFIGVIAFALLLLLIPGVDALGKSLLASAGVAGIVLSFAAQQSLGTLFAGLQLALTQPIRLGDKVVTQGETGIVEEITATYVVIRTWDLRGLVVPISSFITQPFQNLSRNAVSQITAVKIRADFSLPVSVLRDTVKGWLETNPLWDRKTFALQVTDSDGGSLEVRVLASAAPAQAFDLQCQIREQLLSYLHEKHNSSLPGVRNLAQQPAPTPAPATPPDRSGS